MDVFVSWFGNQQSNRLGIHFSSLLPAYPEFNFLMIISPRRLMFYELSREKEEGNGGKTESSV